MNKRESVQTVTDVTVPVNEELYPSNEESSLNLILNNSKQDDSIVT